MTVSEFTRAYAITLGELARLLGVDRRLLARQLETGEVKIFWRSGRSFILLEDLLEKMPPVYNCALRLLRDRG